MMRRLLTLQISDNLWQRICVLTKSDAPKHPPRLYVRAVPDVLPSFRPPNDRRLETRGVRKRPAIIRRRKNTAIPVYRGIS